MTGMPLYVTMRKIVKADELEEALLHGSCVALSPFAHKSRTTYLAGPAVGMSRWQRLSKHGKIGTSGSSRS
jgi:hypothetical protein